MKHILRFFASRGTVNQPRMNRGASAFPTTQTTSGDIVVSLHLDFEELLYRNESIGSLCVETVSLIMNSSMLKESQKAIQRADDQRRLTILAYLFLPLQLVTSTFGMNVTEFGQGPWHIWFPIAICFPVLVISLLFIYPQGLKRLFSKPYGS